MPERRMDEPNAAQWGPEGDGGIYVAMLLAGTIDLIWFGAIYLAYTWWLG